MFERRRAFGSVRRRLPHPRGHQRDTGLGFAPLGFVVRRQRRGDVVRGGVGVTPVIFVVEERCWENTNQFRITRGSGITPTRKQTLIVTAEGISHKIRRPRILFYNTYGVY